MLEDSFYWVKRGISIALLVAIAVFVYRGLVSPGLEARKVHRDIVRISQSSQDMTLREACRNLTADLKSNYPFLVENDSFECRSRKEGQKIALEVAYDKRIKLYDNVFVVNTYALDSNQPFFNTYKRESGV